MNTFENELAELHERVLENALITPEMISEAQTKAISSSESEDTV